MTFFKKVNLIKLDLQLFSEDESAQTSEGAVFDTEGVGQNPTDTEGVSQNPTDNMGVGQNPTDTDSTAESFDTLIGKGGRFEQDYHQRMNAAIQERIKGVAPKAQAYDRLLPTMQRLGQRYGIDGSDIEAVIKAVNEDTEIDDAMYESEAIENGWTVAHTKEVHRLRAIEKEQNDRRQFEQFFEGCRKQSEELRGTVPDFDFDSEFRNNQTFGQLVSSGISVKNAYFATHADEYIENAVKAASEKATQQVVNSVIAGSKRPNEGGSRSQGSASFGVRVEDLTNSQLEEYSRRVMNGEKIDFVNFF